MMAQVQLGNITADVVLKDIKNVHLSVYPRTDACALLPRRA